MGSSELAITSMIGRLLVSLLSSVRATVKAWFTTSLGFLLSLGTQLGSRSSNFASVGFQAA
jgi:hypothetical protein